MSSTSSFVILVAFICYVNGEHGKLPSYIKPCAYDSSSFSECVKKQIETALPQFTKGIPDLGVPSIDPVSLNDIVIDGSGLKLSFTEAKMYGLSESKLTNFKVTLGKTDETFTLAFKCDLELKSQYKADGRILILPIQGNGDAIIKAKNVEVTIDSKLVHVKDNNGEHFKLVTPTYKYTIEKTTFDLKNLFNGNKELAETTLQFANNNWQQLMDELSPPAIKQIVRNVIKVINKFFSEFTINNLVEGYEASS